MLAIVASLLGPLFSLSLFRSLSPPGIIHHARHEGCARCIYADVIPGQLGMRPLTAAASITSPLPVRRTSTCLRERVLARGDAQQYAVAARIDQSTFAFVVFDLVLVTRTPCFHNPAELWTLTAP